MMLKKALFLTTALAIIPAAYADSGDDKMAPVVNTAVKDMSCAQFLMIDHDTLPVAVGFLYRLNQETGNIDVVNVDALENVSVEDVVNYCQQNPDAKASTATQK